MEKPRLLRITTVPISLHLLLRGQFRYMKEQGFDVYTMSAEGPETPEVAKEGAPHFTIPFTRKITPVQDLICLWKLVLVLRKLRPAIVHTHTPKAGLLGMMAAWICRVPVRMHTVAGLPLMESTGIKRKVLEFTERITYACAHRVYPNSQGLRTFMLESLHVAPQKISIIGKGSTNGINSSYFNRQSEPEAEAAALREKHGITPADLVFSFVGRVVKDKGLRELVSAFKGVTAALPDQRIFLLLVGPFEPELDPLDAGDQAYLDETDRVIKAGFQRDVRPWILASDVFVFPSYREGFPNVVMQASCLGVPSIVSDINGCNEIIRHEETGLIVPPKDANALQQAMLTLASDKGKRTRFADAAREYVVAHFDQQFVWQRLKQEYVDQLNSKK